MRQLLSRGIVKLIFRFMYVTETVPSPFFSNHYITATRPKRMVKIKQAQNLVQQLLNLFISILYLPETFPLGCFPTFGTYPAFKIFGCIEQEFDLALKLKKLTEITEGNLE